MALKRKGKSIGRHAANKKQKYEVTTLNDLPWQSVTRSMEVGLEGGDDMVMLEEVEGVEVVYEETPTGRVAKFNVRLYLN